MYLCTDSLIPNTNVLLHSKIERIVLISGDSDTSLSDALIDQPAIRSLLASERLIAWYAQNLACNHPKIYHLPIGLDYHTVNDMSIYWSLTKRSPIAQESELIQTLKQSPAFSDKYFQAYSNWHFTIDRGDRRECFSKVDKNLCYFEAAKLPRLASWQRQSQFMFTLSPFGAGLDCHRTWETLVLGGIPIVRKSSISELFQTLPVLIVDDWSDLTSNLLSSFASEALSKKYDFSSLFLRSWTRKFRHSDHRSDLKEMTLKEFKEFITGSTC